MAVYFHVTTVSTVLLHGVNISRNTG